MMFPLEEAKAVYITSSKPLGIETRAPHKHDDIVMLKKYTSVVLGNERQLHFKKAAI